MAAITSLSYDADALPGHHSIENKPQAREWLESMTGSHGLEPLAWSPWPGAGLISVELLEGCNSKGNLDIVDAIESDKYNLT